MPAAMKKLVEQAATQVEIETGAAEDVAEVDAAEQVFRREACDAGKAAAIVFGAFFWVGQDRVGFGDLFEAFFCACLLVAVGVVFKRQRAEGILDRLGVGIVRDAENLVVVLFGGRNGQVL